MTDSKFKLAPLTIKQLLALSSYANIKRKYKNIDQRLTDICRMIEKLEEERERLLKLPQNKQNCLDLGFNPDEYLLND